MAARLTVWAWTVPFGAILIACSGDQAGDGDDSEPGSASDGTTSGVADCEPDSRTRVPTFLPPSGATGIAVNSTIVFELEFDADTVVPTDCWREWYGILFQLTSPTSAEEVPGTAIDELVSDGRFRWQFIPDDPLPEHSRFGASVYFGSDGGGSYYWIFETGGEE